MSNVTVQKIREPQGLPLLRETMDLLESVQKRAFELSQGRGGAPGREIDDWLQAEREIFQVPSLELAESDGEFQLELALPGFEAKDIRVAALPDVVLVEAESAHQHSGANGSLHVCEFGERRVFRKIPLPELVDVDHVLATLDKGLLHVRAAKASQPKGKKAAA